jgi:hypothetical protein
MQFCREIPESVQGEEETKHSGEMRRDSPEEHEIDDDGIYPWKRLGWRYGWPMENLGKEG